MGNELKIKVCGMKYPGNIKDVASLGVDILGFIFYPLSKRYIGNLKDVPFFNTSIHKAGVFVDEGFDEIKRKASAFELTHIQLHGNESPEFCQKMKEQGLQVFKVFRVNQSFDFNLLIDYESCVDYFLFDTKAELPGGTGKKFDWAILKKYQLATPFFLSGGIKPEDADAIKQINHPALHGIDLNSGFEEMPGLKNIGKLKDFMMELKETR